MVSDRLFPTMVIGSLPRPQWIQELVGERETGKISGQDFDRVLDNAIPFAVAMQERAGIDIVSDGEWRRYSYATGFSGAVGGIEKDVFEVKRLTGGARKCPGVVSKLEYRKPIAVDEARFLKKHAKAKVKVALPSPYMIDRWFYDPTASRDAYPLRSDLVGDAADILREEVLALREAGVDIIQFDDAMIGRFVGEEYSSISLNPNVKITMADRDRELEMAVRGMNRVLEGIDGITSVLHVCRGHNALHHAAKGGFEPLVPFLYRMNVDILALELASDDAGTADALRGFPEDKVLGLGVIDVISRTIDPPELLVERVKEMMRYVDHERIILNPDCGFAPSHYNPVSLDEAYQKLRSVAMAADQLRREFS